MKRIAKKLMTENRLSAAEFGAESIENHKRRRALRERWTLARGCFSTGSSACARSGSSFSLRTRRPGPGNPKREGSL
jgi:hypothetical protein